VSLLHLGQEERTPPALHTIAHGETHQSQLSSMAGSNAPLARLVGCQFDLSLSAGQILFKLRCRPELRSLVEVALVHQLLRPLAFYRGLHPDPAACGPPQAFLCRHALLRELHENEIRKCFKHRLRFIPPCTCKLHIQDKGWT
jgi:hypothetical protein